MVIVVKFGGSLLTNAKDYLSAAKRVAKLKEKEDVVVVVSAMKGITSRLIGLMSSRDPMSELIKVFSEHLEVLKAITRPSESSLKRIRELMESSLKTLGSLNANGGAIKDEIVSLGERLSIILLKEALMREGIEAVALNGSEVGVLTDENYGEARPLFDECLKAIHSSISPIVKRGITPVVAGFTGVTKSGKTTTLGRGGSDLTASLIASAIEAKEVLLFTSVPGIMTCDPSLLKSAKALSKVSYDEANVMARLRVKKFHPLTFYPVLRYRRFDMKFFVGRPEGVGTYIVKNRVPPPMKVVSKLDEDLVVVGHGAEIVEELIRKSRLARVTKSTKFENYVVLSSEDSSANDELLNLVHNFILRMLNCEVVN